MTKSPTGRKRGQPRKSKPNASTAVQAPPPANLNAKQAAFCDQYMIDFNASQAAIRAGYSKKTSTQIGSRLLRNVHVSQEISARRATLAGNLADLSEDRIRLEMARCAFANMGDYMVPNSDGSPRLNFAKLTRDQTAALQEVTIEEFTDGRSDRRKVRRVKFKLVDKRGSLELLAKHKGMLVDKVDHTHKHQGLILHALLKDIAAAQSGKPIVEIEDETEAEGEAV